MNGNDAPAFYKEPQHARVQLADVAQLEQSVTQCLGQRFAVILAIAQFFQSRRHRREIVAIAGLELQ